MNYQFLNIYNDFLLKKINFTDFINELDTYLRRINSTELEYFYNYTTDDQFLAFDQDMVMLTYLNLWLISPILKKRFPLSGADNIYLSFIKSVIDEYPEFKQEPILIEENLNYLIYQFDKSYLIINTLDFDIDITLPEKIKNTKAFCINCNEELQLENKVSIYPYGFMLLTLDI